MMGKISNILLVGSIKHGDKYHNGQGYTRKNRLVKRPRLSGDLAAIGDAAMGTGFELTNEMPLL